MANFGRILLGLLTGGFSEVFRSIPNHFAAKSSNSSADDFIKDLEGMIKSQIKTDVNPSYLSKMDTTESYDISDGNGLEDYIKGQTGAGLTTAERQANAFNRLERIEAQNFEHNEAVDARLWQQYVESNKYAWNTESMQNAGVNPALVYGGGNLVGTAATGATGSSSPANSVSPSHASSMGDLFNMLFSLVRLPKEMKQLDADIAAAHANAEKAEKEGNAAMMNAESNKQNAETNARNAAVQERLATVQEMRQQVDAAMAESNMSVNEATVTHIAKQCSILEKQYLQMDAQLAIAEKNANSQEKQAIAALRNADAAVQNAATNDYLSNYQTSLMWAQELLAWANGEGQEIVNRYLDDNEKAKLENLNKQNLILDEQKRLVHKQGNLATAQMVREYVNCATDIANSVSRFTGININTGSAPSGSPMPAHIGGTYYPGDGYGYSNRTP